MSRDELIRRALMHIRNGYAVGGKPGESAMSRAEAERGVSSGTGNVGGVRDGGYGGAGAGMAGAAGDLRFVLENRVALRPRLRVQAQRISGANRADRAGRQ